MVFSPQTTGQSPSPGQEQKLPFAEPEPAGVKRRKKLLIADDNCVFLKALSMKLRNSGYEVFTTQDGASTVSMARQEKPDLVLLDINFPSGASTASGAHWDGLLVMEWLRRLEEVKDTPVIIITSEDPAHYEKRSLAAGAVAFFRKPVDLNALLLVICQVLSGGRPTPSAAS
jgi:CheY-like chemotaxis protein